MRKVIFTKERSSFYEQWEFQVESVSLLSEKEEEYISNQIDIRKFNQPKDGWLQSLLGEFERKFGPEIAKYLNDRNGKVITTMQLQDRFRAHYYTKDKR